MGKSRKQFLINRSKKIERKRRKRKNKIKRQNRGVNKQLKTLIKQKKHQANFKTFLLEENYSLKDNPNTVVRNFKDYQSLLRKGYDINFDLSGLKNLSPGGLALFAAGVKDETIKGDRYIKGNLPIDHRLRQMIRESGFLKLVRTSIDPGRQKHHLVHRKTYKKVEPPEAEKACIFSIQHTFGDKRIIRPLYEILIECMANTKNHADKKSDEVYNWWLFVFKKENGNSAFTFLDFGVGIFKSYPVLHYMNLKRLFNDNTEIVDDLLEGKIKSSTKIVERGQGIPLIYEHSKTDLFKEFYLISNDVFVDFKSGRKVKLQNNFSGTFYYWEIQK